MVIWTVMLSNAGKDIFKKRIEFQFPVSRSRAVGNGGNGPPPPAQA